MRTTSSIAPDGIPPRARRAFEARRVLEAALYLGLAVVTAAGWMGGAAAAIGALVGTAAAILAFLWLERSLLRPVGGADGPPDPPLHPASLMAGAVGRLLLLAALAAATAVLGGAAAGGGFLAGLLAVKAAVLIEGIRSHSG